MKGKQSEIKMYDADMIEHFLRHLTAAVEVGFFENASRPVGQVFSEEKYERMAGFVRKYPIALLFADHVEADGATGEECLRALEILAKKNAALQESQCHHLVALQPLFAEVMLCLRSGHAENARLFKARKLLDQESEAK